MNSLAGGVELLQENERAIKQDTSMPDVNFGQFDASIITGKAVNALQGAGTGSLVEMVQGGGIGRALESWNEKALTIYQRMFTNDAVYLQGVQAVVDDRPEPAPVRRQLQGQGDHRVAAQRGCVLAVHRHARQARHGVAVAGGRAHIEELGSREQIGISDSESMQEDIVTEVIDEAVVGAIVAALQADPSPENADNAAAQATAYLEANPMPTVAPHPLLGAGAAGPQIGGGTAGPPVGPQVFGAGNVSAPPLPLPQGSAPPAQIGAPGGPVQRCPRCCSQRGRNVGSSTSRPVESTAARQGVPRRRDRREGQHRDAVEVAVTDEADKQPLTDAATGFTVTFTSVAGEPTEPFVEIGTGRTGGQAPSADQLLA
jgi:hypothetical protein